MSEHKYARQIPSDWAFSVLLGKEDAQVLLLWKLCVCCRPARLIQTLPVLPIAMLSHAIYPDTSTSRSHPRYAAVQDARHAMHPPPPSLCFKYNHQAPNPQHLHLLPPTITNSPSYTHKPHTSTTAAPSSCRTFDTSTPSVSPAPSSPAPR